MNNVTFIICTKNASDTIFDCLISLRHFPVIVVDKNSTDGTLEIAGKFDNVKIIKQRNTGIAAARNLGLKYVETKFVCMWGCDNVLKNIKDIDKIIDFMEKEKWVGCSFLTKVVNPKTYFDKCMAIWWTEKFTDGQRLVIGTPVIYKTDVLKKLKYDEKCSFSDDTDLGEKIRDGGYKQGYSDITCYDITPNTFSNIAGRFLMYGKSDSEYYKKYSNAWNLKRKIKSWLHPIESNWIKNLTYFPFFVIITVIRYIGWIRNIGN